MAQATQPVHKCYFWFFYPKPIAVNLYLFLILNLITTNPLSSPDQNRISYFPFTIVIIFLIIRRLAYYAVFQFAAHPHRSRTAAIKVQRRYTFQRFEKLRKLGRSNACRFFRISIYHYYKKMMRFRKPDAGSAIPGVIEFVRPLRYHFIFPHQ